MAIDLAQLQTFLHTSRLPPLRYLAVVLSLFFISLIALSSDHAPSITTVTRWSSSKSSETWTSGGEKKAAKEAANKTAKEGPTLANATFVILARNSDVWEIVSSIRGMEDRFNKNYHYPYTFLNDEPFSDEFKTYTSGVASGPCTYGLIPKEHWGEEPEWIDQEKAAKARDDMAKAGVIYGGSLPYRHMCRYQSGFFWRHPLLDQYKYYWRIEPNVKYFCDIDYDPFVFMAEKKKKYGFVLTIYEYIETIPTLWDATKEFMAKYPEYLPKNNLADWLSSDGGKTYNRCHFWSNFEIGDLDFWRGEAYTKYFEHLDKAGGFFYERWGDAPVHSIAAALFLEQDELHFFEDIGYRHEPFQHCPKGRPSKCACNPDDTFESHWYSCTPSYKQLSKWKPGMLQALGS
ncbi:glycosyl transferase [Meredithblackwellia eburnea MCA 4105]